MLTSPVIDDLPSPDSPVARTKEDYRYLSKSRSSSFSQSSQSSHESSTSRKFHHHREPTVLDNPYAMEAIRNALLRKNTSLLAQLVRKFGLPPSLRSAAWPVLLRTHPHVEAALANVPAPVTNVEEIVTERRLRGDINRLRRYRGPDLLDNAIFDAIHAFLTKWGSTIGYDNAMVWIADFLASGDIGVGDSDSGRYSNGRIPSRTSSNSSGDMSSAPKMSDSTHYATPTESEFTQLHSEDAAYAFSGVSPELLPEVFEHVVLLMHCSPPNFSDFIGIVRQVMPELSHHFSYEGVLTGGTGGDDWLVWWLRWFGIRAFSPSMVARLWDDYFAYRDEQTITLARQHMFNCILLMREYRTKLLELDQSECRQFLAHVPKSRDIEALLKEARTLANSPDFNGS